MLCTGVMHTGHTAGEISVDHISVSEIMLCINEASAAPPIGHCMHHVNCCCRDPSGVHS